MKTNNLIHLLARAVILADGHLLLARSKDAANTFLPGGHLGYGERATDAFCRELAEELGLPAQVGVYLGAVEHTWSEGNYRQHEITHVFAAAILGAHAEKPIESREPHLEFHLALLADLERHNVRPAPLIELVRRYASGQQVAFWGFYIAD